MCSFFAEIGLAQIPAAEPGTTLRYQLRPLPVINAMSDIFLGSLRHEVEPRYSYQVLGVMTESRNFDDRPDCYILPIPRWRFDEPAPVRFRQIDPDRIDFEILRGWINHCQNHHADSCTPLEPDLSKQLPGLRLIDCQTRCIIVAPENCDYTALSYVWGSPGQEQDKNLASKTLAILPTAWRGFTVIIETNIQTRDTLPPFEHPKNTMKK